MEAIDFDSLGWLVNVPTGDSNFTRHLKAANATTIRSALARVPTNHKTKVKALETRLRQLEKGEGMAPKTKEPRAHDVEAEAATQIYQVAQADAENRLAAMREEIESLKQESFGMGALHAIEANISYNEFLRAVTLLRIKKEKEYRKGGMTWDVFCESRGLERRTVDRMLDDFAPIFNSFSDNLSGFTGMPFSKIRLLGKCISDNLSEIKDGFLIYGDENIPVTPAHADEIQALIERICEESKEKVEELEATVSAKDKVLKSKGDVINKMERDLKKFEKDAAKKGLTLDEDAFLQLMSNKKTSFEGYMLSMDPDFVMENAGDITPRMRAALIAALHEMKMNVLSAYDTAVLSYGSPDLNPEVMEEYEAWALTNLPGPTIETSGQQ